MILVIWLHLIWSVSLKHRIFILKSIHKLFLNKTKSNPIGKICISSTPLGFQTNSIRRKCMRQLSRNFLVGFIIFACTLSHIRIHRLIPVDIFPHTLPVGYERMYAGGYSLVRTFDLLLLLYCFSFLTVWRVAMLSSSGRTLCSYSWKIGFSCDSRCAIGNVFSIRRKIKRLPNELWCFSSCPSRRRSPNICSYRVGDSLNYMRCCRIEKWSIVDIFRSRIQSIVWNSIGFRDELHCSGVAWNFPRSSSSPIAINRFPLIVRFPRAAYNFLIGKVEVVPSRRSVGQLFESANRTADGGLFFLRVRFPRRPFRRYIGSETVGVVFISPFSFAQWRRFFPSLFGIVAILSDLNSSPLISPRR